jgi:hypothetical protein
VGRCWSSIDGRVKSLSYWGTGEPDLVERLRKWRPAEGELQSSKEFEPNWPKSVATFFSYHDLKPTAPGKYIMNASTAPKWIGAIATILDVLRRVFKEESKDSTSKFLNKLRVEGVNIFTYILYAIICNRELQDLFGLNSLKEITPEYLAATHFNPNPQPGENSAEESRSDTAKRTLDAAEVDHGEFYFRFLSISE